MSRLRLSLVSLALVASSGVVHAQALDSATLAGFRWRTVGPANFEGRASDVVGIPFPSKTYFVATAGGGIWKTTNNGTTYRPVFDNYKCVSMGMIAIAPSDTQQVWAGSGEPNSRNTIEPGCGIFKSTDGGLTWKHMGLDKTQHIGRVVVDYTDPNVVYVAALGAAWKADTSRGIYKTTDGGVTWKKIKAGANDRTGFVDIAMNPKDHNTLFASSWQRYRTPYSLNSGGPGSGLWKTTDGGATWTEIKGNGYPEQTKGRIGLAISLSNPDVVYALTEADSNPNPKPAKGQARQQLNNGLYRSADGGKTWVKTNNADTRPFYYSQVRVHPTNPDRVWFSSTQVLVSNEGGKNARLAVQDVHVDHHGMWIDPKDPDRMIVANDGGTAISYDGGGNWQFGAKLPVGQFYEVSYDFEVPYNVCSGAQDNGSWCGPSKHKNAPSTNAYWFTIAGGDGFYTAQHPLEPWIVFGESQGGSASRLNLKTGERTQLVKPTWRPRYTQMEDSILYERGDTAKPATKDVTTKLADLRSRQRMDSVDLDMRFNWNSPLFISEHNPDVIYMGGNRLLKSTKRGDDLYPISPDLSKKNYARIDTSMRKTGGITLDATGAETYGTIVTVGESYMKPGYLWAGTDDGNVWFTRNDGATWEAIPMSRFPGIPSGDVYVSRIEASHYDTLTAYVAFDNHRWNDFTPYLYVTTDGGKTFKSIVNNLPKDGVEDIRAFREDPVNRDLLYVGTAMAVYVSLDRGMNWQRFMTGMPNVPVYDLKIHPRDHDLIAATHGRGIWIVDIAPLQQMTKTVVAKAVNLFDPKPAFEYGEGPQLAASGNGNAQANFEAPSPTHGGEIAYRLASNVTDRVTITITDAKGDTLTTLNGSNRAGINRVVWNYRGRARPRAALTGAARRDSILAAQRAMFVADSLDKDGKIPKTTTDRIRALVSGQGAGGPGGFGGGGGRGGGGGGGGANGALIARLGPGGNWVARPGEGAAAGGGGGGGGGGGFGAAAALLAPAEGDNPAPAAGAAALADLVELLNVPGRPGVSIIPQGGRGGGGGGFGGGQAPISPTGDYLVTLRVGNEVQKTVLRLEHVRDGSGQGSTVPEDFDAEKDPVKAKKKQ